MSRKWPEIWENELQGLMERDLLRQLRQSAPRPAGRRHIAELDCIDLSSNDYLGLAGDRRVIEALADGAGKWGAGATASRMIVGHTEAHMVLEQRLAALKGTEAALVYASGYQTNLGLFPALISRHDVAIADRLCHASILDGIQLSGAKLERFRHNDPDHLEKILSATNRRALVVTESVFSMDGDVAPLPEILERVIKHGALLVVDEAHATGVLGDRGAGAWEYFNLPVGPDVPVVLMGTLSKAVGCQGGFICGQRRLIDYLVNRSRSFIFSTGLSPALAWASVKALDILTTDRERRATLQANTDLLRSYFDDSGPPGITPIIPVIVGDARKSMEVSKRLLARNVLTVAVRPPTVPEGTSRLRMTVSAVHCPEDLRSSAEIIKEEIASV
ncbi:MAG: 8-amino-7-oxononanoate synthase [bacterium]